MVKWIGISSYHPELTEVYLNTEIIVISYLNDDELSEQASLNAASLLFDNIIS